MSGYRLECTVCSLGFSTRKDWLQHLLEEVHQSVAREECHQWFQDDTIKKCVVVAFATFPLASSSILSHFSKGTTIVTDFVWWAHKPKFGLLQFESSLKVDELLKSGSLITVDSQQVHLRKMSVYHQLEWDQIVPRSNGDKLEITNTRINVSPKQISRSVPLKPERTQAHQTGKATDDYDETLKQFEAILKKVEISSTEYEIANYITTNLTQLAIKTFGSDSYCQASLFRNWYLGYKNSGENNLLIFVECRDTHPPRLPTNISFTFSLNRNLSAQKMLREGLARQLFPNITEIRNRDLKNSDELLGNVGTLCEYTMNQQKIKFTLVATPSLATEVYTCHLIKYMCSFDPRVKPLIHLVGYWASVNCIKLAGSKVKSKKSRKTLICSETVLLELLVVFFCCVKRIIPTPRYIKAQDYVPVRANRMDVGFNCSQSLLDQWTSGKSSPSSRELARNVCQLAQEFFSFCSELRSKPCLLNMRDGEVIREEEFRVKYKGSPSTWDTSVFTKKEIFNWKAKMSGSSPLTIIPPLLDKQIFLFDNDRFKHYTSKVMKNTANKLAKFCKSQSNELEPNQLQSALFCDLS